MDLDEALASHRAEQTGLMVIAIVRSCVACDRLVALPPGVEPGYYCPHCDQPDYASRPCGQVILSLGNHAPRPYVMPPLPAAGPVMALSA
jgi:hypothetical protein